MCIRDSHNDRRFDVENSEHIDAERARQNVYWDCYRGFTTHEFRENPEQPDFSFEEIERMYYYEHYGGHVEAQNLSLIHILWPNASLKSCLEQTMLPV